MILCLYDSLFAVPPFLLSQASFNIMKMCYTYNYTNTANIIEFNVSYFPTKH